MRQMGNGTMKDGIPNWGLGVVDVRDVAKVHMAAAFTPEAKGRYITSGHNAIVQKWRITLTTLWQSLSTSQKNRLQSAALAYRSFDECRINTGFIARNIGYPWIGDNFKSVQELGAQYRPLSETMNDFFQQMVDTKQV